MKGKPGDGREREIPAPKADPAMHDTDDHVMSEASQKHTQPTDELDPGVDDEHLNSPSQGVRPER